jgi:hypothetical protein
VRSQVNTPALGLTVQVLVLVRVLRFKVWFKIQFCVSSPVHQLVRFRTFWVGYEKSAANRFDQPFGRQTLYTSRLTGLEFTRIFRKFDRELRAAKARHLSGLFASGVLLFSRSEASEFRALDTDFASIVYQLLSICEHRICVPRNRFI